MNSPDSRLDFTLSPGLNFEVVLRDSEGREVAGVLFIDGGWKISTDPLAKFSSKAEALKAWETNFDHQSGMPLPYAPSIAHEAKKNGAG